ncbi:MAG: hypothetical protein ABL927_02400 [Bdellovibrionales bacterium]
MKFYIVNLLVILFSSIIALGEVSFASSCSAWKKDNSVSCIFAEKNSSLWTRACEDTETTCKSPRSSHAPCDSETICVEDSVNPNELEDICTSWKKSDSVTCLTGSALWIRACQMSWIPTEICSDKNPNDYSLRANTLYLSESLK